MMIYVALSYVWGLTAFNKPIDGRTDSCSNTTEPVSLLNAPLTIKDVITVPKNIGQLYLWVGRYCVEQSECPERHKTIQNMDQIYEHAAAMIGHLTATIAALDCLVLLEFQD
jgi:Heterokaryon incompatibility protein (HET)